MTYHRGSSECDVNLVSKRFSPILTSFIFILVIIAFRQFYNFTLDSKATPSATPSAKNVKIVILLAYPRSGSSFTGEIISQAEKSSYFFEPIYYALNVRSDSSTKVQLFLLRAMIECNGDIMSAIQSESRIHIVRRLNGIKVKKNCSKAPADLHRICIHSPLRIIKTIRLRMSVLQNLLSELATNSAFDIKIVHLLRDPRAMLASVYKYRQWKKVTKNTTVWCELFNADLQAGQTLPQHQYKRLRYEDLQEHPQQTVSQLFKFLRIQEPIGPLNKYLDRHMHAEKYPFMMNDQSKRTTRNSSFDPHHWKKEAKTKFIEEVETACQWSIDLLGYKRLAKNANLLSELGSFSIF